MPNDPYCAAGRLIPKRRAPKCSICGRVLWKAIHKDVHRAPTHNAKGERLGYVTYHRYIKMIVSRQTKATARCWNGKACEKRAAKGKVDASTAT